MSNHSKLLLFRGSHTKNKSLLECCLCHELFEKGEMVFTKPACRKTNRYHKKCAEQVGLLIC